MSQDDRVYPNNVWPQSHWHYHPYNDWKDVLHTWEPSEVRDADPLNANRMADRHHHDMRREAIERANAGAFTESVDLTPPTHFSVANVKGSKHSRLVHGSYFKASYGHNNSCSHYAPRGHW